MLIKRTLWIKAIAFQTITWFSTFELQTLKKRRLLISFVPIYTSAPSGIVSHAVSEMSLGRLFLQSSFYFETRFLPAHFRLWKLCINIKFCSLKSLYKQINLLIEHHQYVCNTVQAADSISPLRRVCENTACIEFKQYIFTLNYLHFDGIILILKVNVLFY